MHSDNEQQIEFWPKLFLNIPTDMLFLERGRIEIPDKSNVRIVSAESWMHGRLGSFGNNYC